MIRGGVRRAFRLALRRRDRWEREVEDEITLHLTLRAEQLASHGADPQRAYDEAVRRFGGLAESRRRLIDAARHREQRMHRAEYFEDLRQDFSFFRRALRRQRGWTAVVLSTFALGIGATTAVFSAVSSLLLHPLPYPNADRVVFVDQQPGAGNKTGISVSISPTPQVVREWRKSSRAFDALEPYGINDLSLKMASGDASFVTGIRVLPTFLQFAGQHPLLGRMFDSTDVVAGGRVALIGEVYWRQHFGGDARVLGKVITLDDTVYTVIGVAPATLHSPWVAGQPQDMWLPLDLRSENVRIRLVGRLRRNVSVTAAARELDAVWSASRSEKGALPFNARVRAPAQTVGFRDSLLMLTGAVGLVLLVACANVAHLFIARSAARERELAVRAALGAGRGRIFRQLLTESVLLSLAGAILGCGVGWLGLRGMIAMRPSSLSELDAAHLDGTTLLVAIGVTAICAVGFGVIGARRFSRGSTHATLKEGTAGGAGSRGRTAGRSALVVSEMALCGTLVVGAALLVRSAINLQRADLGFDPRGLYHTELVLPKQYFPTPASRSAFVREFVTRMRSVRGITEIALTSTPPGWRNFSVGRLEIQGEPVGNEGSTSFIDINAIEPGFFRVMNMRLTQGSTFTDTSDAAAQVVVNQAFAKAHWPNGNVIGAHIRIAAAGNEPWLTIVGVANDAATSGPGSASTSAMIYSPARDLGRPSIMIRAVRDAQIVMPLQALATMLDSHATSKVSSVEDGLSQSLAAPRFVALLLSTFTSLALLLAAVGMYGIMAYTVMRETREIGIRIALGASRERIAGRVLARGTGLAIVGSTIGLVAAAWGTKLIEHQLFGVARSDVTSFAVAVVVLTGVAVVACIVPTRRALAVDPMTAIRSD